MRRDDDTLLLFRLLWPFLEDIEPDQLPAKLDFIGIKRDKAAQHQFGLLEIPGLLKNFQLEKLNAKILVANNRVAVEGLHCALGVAALQALGGKDDHRAAVRRVDGKRRFCVADSALRVVKLQQQQGSLRQ